MYVLYVDENLYKKTHTQKKEKTSITHKIKNQIHIQKPSR